MSGCNVCGGKLVTIRPRYPKGEPREVCPVCLQDRIEMVRDILNPATYQAEAARTEATDTGEEG